MKISFLLIISGMLVITGCSQAKKVTVTPAKVVQIIELTNPLDSFSYAIGLSISNFYKEQGVDSINDKLVVQALIDSRKDSALLTDEQVNSTIISYMDGLREAKAAGAKKEGAEFLEKNKQNEGVIVLPSGLQYQILTAGTGEKPTINDKVKVHYTGKLLNGFIFDSSVERGDPIDLNVNQVIPGWTEALLLMPAGSKWKLFIPSNLAYGDNDAGPDIKAGSTLIFEVELIEIVK